MMPSCTLRSHIHASKACIARSADMELGAPSRLAPILRRNRQCSQCHAFRRAVGANQLGAVNTFGSRIVGTCAKISSSRAHTIARAARTNRKRRKADTSTRGAQLVANTILERSDCTRHALRRSPLVSICAWRADAEAATPTVVCFHKAESHVALAIALAGCSRPIRVAIGHAWETALRGVGVKHRLEGALAARHLPACRAPEPKGAHRLNNARDGGLAGSRRADRD